MATIPEEYKTFKFLVFKDKNGSLFYTRNMGKEIPDEYELMAGFQTIWECQEFADVPEKYRSDDRPEQIDVSPVPTLPPDFQ